MKRDRARQKLMILEELYVRNILEKIGMGECKLIGTPLDAKASFEPLRDDEDVYDIERYSDWEPVVCKLGHLALISPKLWALLVFNIGVACRVPRYLKGTLRHGVLHSGSKKLVGWSDADWAGEQSTRRTASGFVLRYAKPTRNYKLVHLLSNLGLSACDRSILFEDNQGAIALVKNLVEHRHTKHSIPFFPREMPYNWNDSGHAD